jgi:hypothetical protein
MRQTQSQRVRQVFLHLQPQELQEWQRLLLLLLLLQLRPSGPAVSSVLLLPRLLLQLQLHPDRDQHQPEQQQMAAALQVPHSNLARLLQSLESAASSLLLLVY